MCQNLLFQSAIIWKMIFFFNKYILIYFIIFVSSVCLTPGFDYAERKQYDNLPKQTWAISDPEHSARVILVPLFSRSVQFLRHSGPSWVSTSPSSGHLDPLTIPLSFFRESKAVLASTIIFFWRYFLLLWPVDITVSEMTTIQKIYCSFIQNLSLESQSSHP